ncbi:MAG: hypothetical protein DRJ62_06065 [Thermoprotei archaeon]|nr:MAG: hypothetical protein DRJ62_06065 [Thermoprotei archaeon]
MGKVFLVRGAGHKPLKKSIELAPNALVVTDKPLELDLVVPVFNLFLQFRELASLPSQLRAGDDVVLDLYMHSSRLGPSSSFASLRIYLRLCSLLSASARAKCFNLYITYSGEQSAKTYGRLKSMVDEEVTC